MGRYRVLVFTSNDLLDGKSVSQTALQSTVESINKFPSGTIDLVVIHPLATRFEWTDLPRCVKDAAEMRTYGLSKREDAYNIYGISKNNGLIAVVRPDGYIGTLEPLSNPGGLENYLRDCLTTI